MLWVCGCVGVGGVGGFNALSRVWRSLLAAQLGGRMAGSQEACRMIGWIGDSMARWQEGRMVGWGDGRIVG